MRRRRRGWRGEIGPEWDWSRIGSIVTVVAFIAAFGFVNLSYGDRAERACRRMYASAHTAVDSALVDGEVFSRRGEPAWTCEMMPERVRSQAVR
jgi:hypothetical protein